MPRVALWGAGVMAGAHAASCRTLWWDIAGVASRTRGRAAQLGEQLGVPAMTYAELLQADDVDIAIVATPPADHLAATRAWTDRSVPTVVSTPLCQTLTDADALVDLERDTSVPILFASNLATAPAAQALFARVAALGALTSLSGRALRTPPTWGAFLTGEWGGGVLLHPGVHQLTLITLIARLGGAGSPTTVSAALQRASTGADDHAEIDLRFESGLSARSTVSWRATNGSAWDLQVSSATGVLRLDMDPRPTLEHNGEPVAIAAAPPDHASLTDAGLIGQLRTFRADVIAGRRPVMNPEFGRTILEIVCAANWSAGRSGEPVALPFDGPRDLTPHELLDAAAQN